MRALDSLELQLQAKVGWVFLRQGLSMAQVTCNSLQRPRCLVCSATLSLLPLSAGITGAHAQSYAQINKK